MNQPPAPRATSANATGGLSEHTIVCSAKGCRAAAAYGLLWNNPKLHTPERRKTWLACENHADPLSDFLSKKGFLKDAVPVAELTDEMG
jgi:hypothetical protein